MSEAPQNDDVINEEVDAVVETNDSVMDSETIAPVEGESETQQVDEVELAKQKANEAFNKQYGEKKQLERDLAEQRKVNEQFLQAEREREAAKVGNIPEIPDPFDDDFEEKVKRRDEALVAQANYNIQNQAYQAQQLQQRQQEVQAKNAKIQESMTNYSQKAVELGIDQNELQTAGNTVAQYGLSDDLVIHILGDSDGPLITKHLAANPQEGIQLAQMSPYEVGSFLSNIKQKASTLKPKTTKTPNPSDNLQGKGHKPSDGLQHIAGAQFD